MMKHRLLVLNFWLCLFCKGEVSTVDVEFETKDPASAIEVKQTEQSLSMTWGMSDDKIGEINFGLKPNSYLIESLQIRMATLRKPSFGKLIQNFSFS